MILTAILLSTIILTLQAQISHLRGQVRILNGCESSLNQRIRKLEEGGKRTPKKGKKPLDKRGT